MTRYRDVESGKISALIYRLFSQLCPLFDRKILHIYRATSTTLFGNYFYNLPKMDCKSKINEYNRLSEILNNSECVNKDNSSF